MTAPFETQLEACVYEAFAVHAIAHLKLAQEVHAALFQYARPHPRLHVLARAMLENYGLDTRSRQRVGEHEPSRSTSNDRHLRPHLGQESSAASRSQV